MQYQSPPIIEAVIEIRFGVEMDQSGVEDICKKLQKKFPVITQVKFHDIEINLQESPELESKETVKTRMADEFESWVCMVGAGSISLSRMAPYDNFLELEKMFFDVWDTAYRVSGFRRVTRIGMRYINRIDVPMKENFAHYEKYLNLRINLPKQYRDVFTYDLSFVVPIDELCRARIASKSMEAALINNASFLLDIDVFCDRSIPQKKSQIVNLISSMRAHKNRLFESFITDKARDLFNARQSKSSNS